MRTVTNGRRRGGLVLGLIALLAALLLSLPAGAQETMRFDEKVRELFFAGFAGNQDALERGMAICEETLADDPDHPGALVWQASGWFYESSFLFARGDSEVGMALYNKSVAQFDRAVALAPDDLQTLIPRAAVYLFAAPYVEHAPTRNWLLETVVGDYTKALELQKPYFDSLTVHGRGELLGALASALWLLERRDEARVYLDRIVAELPDSPYALMAQQQLDDPATPAQLTCLGCHKY
ncbi:MAG: hypothetical protein OXI57_00340 [Rhodospirillales bacterium]|nr:hypothetical protein [Rhodospirillales bacterium]